MGHQEAHTRAELALESAGEASSEERQGILDAAAQLFDEGSPIIPEGDVLELVAEFSNAQRRGPGRPKGAANRRNASMAGYLKAKGHRDPYEFLSLVFSASTNQLAKLIEADPLEVLKVQVRAASEAMPYNYSKKPQTVIMPPKTDRAILFMGDVNITQVAAHLGNAGMVVDVEQNQALSDEDVMREDG